MEGFGLKVRKARIGRRMGAEENGPGLPDVVHTSRSLSSAPFSLANVLMKAAVNRNRVKAPDRPEVNNPNHFLKRAHLVSIKSTQHDSLHCERTVNPEDPRARSQTLLIFIHLKRHL